MGKKILYRSGENRIIAGVAGGVADYFNIDPGIVRIIWVLSAFAAGAGIWAYLIAWAIVPENPKLRKRDLDMSEKGEIKRVKKDWHVVSDGLKIHGRNPMFGLLLLIVGAIFLANNFFPQLRLDKYWPIIPIALGLVLIFSSHNSKK
jgi:phage shock protein PspC (stress-responsive transcriptional regulator)